MKLTQSERLHRRVLREWGLFRRSKEVETPPAAPSKMADMIECGQPGKSPKANTQINRKHVETGSADSGVYHFATIIRDKP